MLSLPSLAPRDSYTLWYTSSSSTHTPFGETPSSEPSTTNHNGQNTSSNSSRRQNALSRTPLARLRQDEEYLERRKQNIQNYGSTWIKPPGITKSLYQRREEERELLEHQEALRREQLQQELAEAEDAAGLLQAETMEGDGEEEVETRDLDDDIPDADGDGGSGAETSEEEHRFSNDDDDDDDDDDEDDDTGLPEQLIVRAQISRAREEQRFAVHRLQSGGDFAEEGASEEEDNSQMLQEEDLVHEHGGGENEDFDMDLDQDLDAEIPEAEAGYEHTDTEEELSSSEDDSSVDQGRLPQQRLPVATSMVRSDGTQNSNDPGSSQRGSSPRGFMTGRRTRGAGH